MEKLKTPWESDSEVLGVFPQGIIPSPFWVQEVLTRYGTAIDIFYDDTCAYWYIKKPKTVV